MCSIPEPTPEEIAAKAVQDKVDKGTCEEIRGAMLALIESNPDGMVLSRSANQALQLVEYPSDVGEHCLYLRYSLRTLAQPYQGKKVSPADVESAFLIMINRTKF
jgi:hypothetical protein